MKYLFLVLFFSFTSVVDLQTVSAQSLPYLVAHRGAWFDEEIPENTVAAVEMAGRFGYQAIECDVKYTADSVMVIMHDNTINRTMRHAKDYAEISTPIDVSKITFKELRTDYVIASSNPALRTPIPTLEELLLACKKNKVVPMLHSLIYESYEMAQRMMGDEWVCFNTDDNLARAAREISDCLILIDIGKDTTGVLERLRSIGGKVGVSTMRKEFLTAHFSEKLRAEGFQVQSSIFSSPHEVQAVSNGISILLTDFSLTGTTMKPKEQWKLKDFSKSKKDVVVKAGETLEKQGNAVDYGGMLVKINFTGALLIELNKQRVYPLTREKEGTAYISIRYKADKPTLKITAKEHTKIADLAVDIFEL